MAKVLPRLDLSHLQPSCPSCCPQPALATACPTHPGCHAILPPPRPGFLRACHLDLIHSAKHVRTGCYPKGVVTSRGCREENKAALTSEIIHPEAQWPPSLPPAGLENSHLSSLGSNAHVPPNPGRTSRCSLSTFTMSSEELSLSPLCYHLAYIHHLSYFPH